MRFFPSSVIRLAALLSVLAIGCRSAADDSLQGRLDTIRGKHGSPALGAALIRDGKLELVVASGVQRNGVNDPALTTDSFHIGSCGKAMTATLIAILVEDGTLAWEQTIGESFPEWSETILDVYHDVTIEQLLLHRGGIRGDVPTDLWVELMQGAYTIPPMEQREMLARRMFSLEAEVTPGTTEVYSNAGYTIAGLMAERATGIVWEELITTRLFEPLGMDSAGFGPPGYPTGEGHIWGHHRRFFRWSPVLHDNPPAIAPAGTMHFTLEDWGKFLSIHAARVDVPALGLSRESIVKLQTEIPGTEDAFGWMVKNRAWGGRALMFIGSNNYWTAVCWVAPEKSLALMAVANRGQGEDFLACDGALVEILKEAGLLD